MQKSLMILFQGTHSYESVPPTKKAVVLSLYLNLIFKRFNFKAFHSIFVLKVSQLSLKLYSVLFVSVYNA